MSTARLFNEALRELQRLDTLVGQTGESVAGGFREIKKVTIVDPYLRDLLRDDAHGFFALRIAKPGLRPSSAEREYPHGEALLAGIYSPYLDTKLVCNSEGASLSRWAEWSDLNFLPRKHHKVVPQPRNKASLESFVFKVAQQMVCAVTTLHQHNLVHNDIHSLNFLVFRGKNNSPLVRLTDFDELASADEKRLRPIYYGNNLFLRKNKRNPDPWRWIPPEVRGEVRDDKAKVNQEKFYHANKKALDLYRLGIAIETFCEEVRYQILAVEVVLEKVKSGASEFTRAELLSVLIYALKLPSPEHRIFIADSFGSDALDRVLKELFMAPPVAVDAKQAQQDVSAWLPLPIQKIIGKTKTFSHALEQKDLKEASGAKANELFLDAAREFRSSARVNSFHHGLRSVAVTARGAIKLADANLFEVCHAADLLSIVQQAVQQFINVNKLGKGERGWSLVGIFFHGQTGKNRAENFSREVSQLVGSGLIRSERQLKLQILHLIGNFLDKAEGRWGEHSFKTILLESLGQKFLTPLPELIPHLESHVPKVLSVGSGGASQDVKAYSPKAASKN